VLDLAVAMSTTPTEVPDELRDRLHQELAEDQIVELVSAIAWEHYRARFNRALDVRPAGFSDGAFCVPPQQAPDHQIGPGRPQPDRSKNASPTGEAGQRPGEGS